MKKKYGVALAAMAGLATAEAAGPAVAYPKAFRSDVVDEYFGEKVADPYRWMENDNSDETAAWVEAERALTSEYLDRIPFRKAMRDRLRTMADYEKIGAPFKKDGKYYYFYNSGLQNQSVLYQANRPGERGWVFLDPNKLSDDGTVALQGISFSEDGKYLAYTISRSGSDWVEIYVMDVATGSLIPDHIQWAKFSGASWYKDGFFYSAYDATESEDGSVYSTKNENHKVYYHRIGTPQSSDRLVYENPDEPLRFYQGVAEEKENVLFLIEAGAGNGNGLYVRNLSDDASGFKCVNDSQDVACSPIAVYDGKIYIVTNRQAPKGKLVVADVAAPDVWEEVLPETNDVLSSASIIDGKLVAVYDKDASNHAYVYTLEGKLLHEVKLPTIGTVSFTGEAREKDAYFSFTSFTYPSTVYRYDIDKNESEVYSKPAIDFNPDDFVTEQVFFTSKDGTRVPMTLTYRKGLERNGRNPLWIYGYGGFNITLYPGYSYHRIYLLNQGFIYAQVNLRGGNEYGEEWHLAGTKMQKQNVFDDFIAAAEWLVDNDYTNRELIVAEGGSNGGLLVGACVNQRPDLYRVAFPRVGVMDMLRYHKFTIGWNWAPDYGTSADSKEMFEYLKAYSPLHNIKNDGTRYPAILVTTADHDDRVVPAHSFKYAATLQASNTGDRPKYIRIDSKAGHGAGKPMEKVIEEMSDIYSFAFYNLGITPKED